MRGVSNKHCLLTFFICQDQVEKLMLFVKTKVSGLNIYFKSYANDVYAFKLMVT